MRSRIALLGLLALALSSLGATASAGVSAQPPITAPGEPLFLVSGRGYGHGVGMSQWGAYGMANAGYTYNKILSYYYPGTQLGRTGRANVRVLLAEGRKATTIASPVPFTVVDASGTAYRLPAGALVLRPDLTLPDPAGPIPAVGPLVVRPGKGDAPLALDGRRYRGSLEVSADGAFLRIVNVVALDPYLESVVAGEMPQGWPAAALQAQAVAARSYALAHLVKGKPFDLYADQRSQVYPGVAGEKPGTTAAVAATSHQVLLYAGKVASTLYFSSSGGRTASAVDVFGVSIPYLVSRPDPWDAASPYHAWGPILFGARDLQAKLGLKARVLDATGVATPSGRLRSLSLVTPSGTTTVPSALLRTGLGLRSTWVTIGVLRLDRPSIAPVVYGSPVRLVGVARALSSPAVAASADGKSWSQVASLQPGPTGAVTQLVRPVRTTRYRFQVAGASTAASLVRVAPRVRMSAVQPQELAGSVRPRLTGARVTVERLGPAGWAPVTHALVDGTGAFRATLDLTPGSYRARVPATAGLAEGMTPVVEVTG